MTRNTNARLAGFTFLLYIALAFPPLFMANKRAADVLILLSSVNAVVLAIALYGITRDVSADLSLLAMACRVGEGVLGAAGAGVKSAFFFAVGSTVFCYLLLRGRLIPRVLAWLGLMASVLLVMLLPVRLADALPLVAVQLMWVPMAAFEIPTAIWLLAKGVPTEDEAPMTGAAPADTLTGVIAN
jgi:hypothetical protein